jgi:hypothetical protein
LEREFSSLGRFLAVVVDAYGKWSTDTDLLLKSLLVAAVTNRNRTSLFDMSRASLVLDAANVVDNTILILEAASLVISARAKQCFVPERLVFRQPERFSKKFFDSRAEILREYEERRRTEPSSDCSSHAGRLVSLQDSALVSSSSVSSALPEWHYRPYLGTVCSQPYRAWSNSNVFGDAMQPRFSDSSVYRPNSGHSNFRESLWM